MFGRFLPTKNNLQQVSMGLQVGLKPKGDCESKAQTNKLYRPLMRRFVIVHDKRKKTTWSNGLEWRDR